MSLASTESCAKSDVFSTATKTEIKRLAGDSCWVCQSTDPQICLVIGKEDKQVDLWLNAGLIDFSLTSAANGIPLCGSCHTQFDRDHDPGIIFIPTDLQYFIDFELDDRKQRSTTTSVLHRNVPTRVMYKDHLMKNNKILEGATSGLYRRIFLKDYLHPGLISPEDLGVTSSKQWHGASIATLRRGIMALGSPRIASLDEATVNQLQTLRDLYFRPTEENPVNIRSSRPLPDHQGEKRPADGDEGQLKSKRVKQDPTRLDKPEDIDGNNSNHQQNRGRAFQDEWILGPDLTTQDVIFRYAPVFAHH
ncbi:hypothetical protein N7536_011301 [Penicillium majusculum]|uniref:HNH nuclease domain-containing protein n=1 Tax=Penicillium solitum TaxID=60172 RepID=A0A1V6QYK7_9EURO|nr:uncharacterized protein PENSOL_c027G02637 [Penicillium solitum]KAJ5680162.1 hypothetical protein N7536_011301 [Penicillium majusculum]OQD94273.1 hypothetical protein PENSOL_c027G02637 [Penicillium solitum]